MIDFILLFKLLKTNNIFLVDIILPICYTKRVMEQYTESFIRHKLATDERWVRRALIRLYQRQTADEKVSQQTRNHNLRGFQPADARWFTRLAEFAIKYPNRPLSEKQLKLVWRPWRNEPAICKYAGQILRIMQEDAQAQTKPVAQQAPAPAAPAAQRQFADCERCGEELPTCRCAYKAAYAEQEAKQEREAFMYELYR